MTNQEVPERPRVWPSLTVGIGAIVLGGLVFNMAAYFAVGPTLGPGETFGEEAIAAWMQQNMDTAKGVLSIMLPIHTAMLLLTLVAAYFSRTPLKQRLGMVCGNIPLWMYPAIVLGSLGTAAIAGWLFLAHMSPSEEQMALALAFTNTTGIDGAVHTFYGIIPGFVEELLFRGFVLLGLLRLWKPHYAIAASTLLFTIAHPEPFFMLHALPCSIWWCILLWRTKSIWPPVVAHIGAYIGLA
ncbi:MAG: CPBP family intramembrane metalloprotease, partial [bacterium]|nr:CPBP family intramembrane metalloprotease [bacterium]